MTILCQADLLASQILVQTGLQQAQVTVFSFFQQGIHRLRLFSFEAIHVQRCQLRVVVTGDLTQLFNGVIQVVTRGNFVRQHAVVL